MGFTPVFDAPETVETLAATDLAERRPMRARTERVSLRYGGFVMDPVTGVTSWCGRTLTLAVDERQLLGVLLRRGGQIVGREYLATALGTTGSTIDERIEHLARALKSTGVSCLPVQVDGLGYVLWRC